MMKSKRFEPIQEIATTSANDLSRAMGEAARKVADFERQIEQLQSYRDEYVRRSGHGTAAIDAVKLQNYRTFLERLGEAVHQHSEAAGCRAGGLREAALGVERKRIEAESLGRAVERFRKEEQHAADRREQREGDDAALRVSLAARSELG